MLEHLVIKNYALIRELEMDPCKGLNIITGETGAGKSIMLGAVGLLLGNRADTKVLFDQNEKCIIEGTFNVKLYDLKKLFEEEDLDYDEHCIIRREVAPNSKSRAFVNDSPVTLDVLKKLGSRLMDVHSQHETLLLGDQDFQISIIDAYAANNTLLLAYREVFRQYKIAEKEYQLVLSGSEEARKQLDYNNYLLQELLDLAIVAGEQEKMESDLKLLENAEEIKSRLALVIQSLSDNEQSIIPSLQVADKNIAQLAKYTDLYNALKARLSGTLLELKDIAAELETEADKVEYSADAIQRLQERLSKIYTLQKKHSVNTVEALLQLQDKLEEEVAKVVNMDDHLADLKSKVEEFYRLLLSNAATLSAAREKVKVPIKTELENLLKEVGMPNASVSIEQSKVEPNTNGVDKISLLFSANKGVAPQELKNAASGGEFSRLMLCIKYILAGKTSLPTIIFDEIDTGISGEIAIKVGKMMTQMGRNHQVIAISHLPQIAAQGTYHYFVYKDNTSERAVSRIRKLSDEDRVKEIAQMIGGAKPSDIAIQNAKELLSIA